MVMLNMNYCGLVDSTLTEQNTGPEFDVRYRQMLTGLDEHLKWQSSAFALSERLKDLRIWLNGYH